MVEVLRRDVDTDHVPHAYLFHGPDGVGKRAAALVLSTALQCHKGGTDPCGACSGCRKVARMIHPDVRVLFPYPGDADEHEVAERIQRLADEPYAAVDFARRPSLDDATLASNKQSIYKIERVHEELLRPMSFVAVEGRYKIAIVTDADAMPVKSANAFLKILEEPPKRTIFILTTSRPESLLPTIVSRCRRVRFDRLPTEIIEQALVTRHAMNPARAGMIARMADGSYGRALELLENETLAQSRDQVVDFLRRAHGMDIIRLSDVIGWISKLGREHVKVVLALMLSWLRDLLLHRSAGDEAMLVNVDQIETIRRFNKNLPDADLAAMVAAVEEAIVLVERNVRVELTLIALGQLFHRATHGQPAGRLFVPLSETT